MATRTPKAATKKPAKAAKPKPAPAAKGKAGKPAKGKAKGEPLVGFEEVPIQEQPPQEPKPGFFARRRAAREERAKAKAEERRRRAEEKAALEAQRRVEEEERARVAAEAEAERQRQAVAEERRREREAAKAEAAAAKEREAEEERLREEEKARAREEAKERRRQQRQAERAAMEERERLAAEAAEEEDRRREAERAARQAERDAGKAARKAEEARREEEAAERAEAERRYKAAAGREEPAPRAPKELEPEMEFQEAAEPVAPERALVRSVKEEGSGDHADKMAAELKARRSKPVVIEGEDLPIPKIPKAKPAEPEPELVTGEAVVDEKYQPVAPPPAPTGLSIPDAFMLVATDAGWDERAEKDKPGRLGGALAGALMLEALQRGRVLVQRDRFTVIGEPGEDDAVEAIADRLLRIKARKGDVGSLRQMAELAKWNRELLEPYKDRLQERGFAEHSHRMHLGLFHRSQVNILDADAQERLRNKLRRAIAGGGTPEASSILILGLLDACGLLGTIVPDEAMDYNRKRLNGLLAGRDIMGYKVDPALKALQEVAIRTVLDNVRGMTRGG